MSLATLNGVERPQKPALIPRYFDTSLIVTSDDNLVYTSAMLGDLIPSMKDNGQSMPGWVYPVPELPPEQRICLDGNRRLAVCRQLGLSFLAFDLGRPVPEAERIQLTFQHNKFRRVMSREEIAEKAARYIEITDCSQGEAALHLKVSHPTLSRAFGERRIPPELKPRADGLGLSIRSLVAALPVPLMPKAIEFAETPGRDGRKPTRDEVSLFIRQLKKSGKPKDRRAKTVTLRMSGRTVTLTVGEKDSAYTVAEDLKAIATKLGKHDTVHPDGWPFLFQ